MSEESGNTNENANENKRDLTLMANQLYASLVKEVKCAGYDPFCRLGNDLIRTDAFASVTADNLNRTTVHGPSIVRDKYTSKYWRKWHREKLLLEDISRKEIIKEKKAIMHTMKKKSLPALPQKTDKNIVTYSFGNPPEKSPSKTFFDKHLLGDSNNTQSLYKDRYQQPVPVDLSVKNASYDPSSIGGRNNVVGGSMTNSSLTSTVKCETLLCNYPPMTTLISDSVGNRFKTAPRFEAGKKSIGSVVSTSNALSTPSRFMGNTQFVFSKHERSTGLSGAKSDTPGPGEYVVPRLFERPKHSADAPTTQIVEASPSYLTTLGKSELVETGCFAQGCSRQEHVMYGMCLDGKCFTRANMEGAVVRSNDLCRLAGYETLSESKSGVKKRHLSSEIKIARAMADIIDEPVYAVSALYSAVFRGDLETIRRLAALRVNPNSRHPESGYTALHAGVFRNQIKAVQCLLECFGDSLDLSVQDRAGDTALHLGSRLGYDDVVGMICDEERCDPQCVVNLQGEYPHDINKNHRVYQHLKIAMDRNALCKELAALRALNNIGTDRN